MVAAGHIELMPNGPLSAMNVDVDANHTQKTANVDTFVEKYVSSVVRQLDNVDGKISDQYTHVWALTGAILMIVLSSLLAILCIFRYRIKIRNKMRVLKTGFADITQRMFETEAREPALPRHEQDSNPPPIRRKRDAVIDQIRGRNHRAQILLDDEVASFNANDSTYISMKEMYGDDNPADRYVQHLGSFSFKRNSSLGDPSRQYPNLSPEIRKNQRFDKDRILEEETEQLKSLCESVSISTPGLKLKNPQE
jgi:hypothetical protein